MQMSLGLGGGEGGEQLLWLLWLALVSSAFSLLSHSLLFPRPAREGGGGRFSYAHLCRGGRTPEKGEFESDLCGQWACEEFKGFKGISLREFVHLVVCTMS